MNKTIGVLAHVDAGKTTFSEQVLYHAGVLRSAGRVDHRDSFLDLHEIEKERGITVFSDQAVFEMDGDRYYWMDTPGHADLCSEMEHVLPVLDYAVLIISCAEGVESHTETVWNLLEKHNVPVLIFINKCDNPQADPEACLRELRARLSPDVCAAFGFDGITVPESLAESIAERDDELFERYLEGNCSDEELLTAMRRFVSERRLFPAFSGSALKDQGINEFMSALKALTTRHETADREPFSARAFKVRRDARGTRRLYVRVLSGCLKVRDSVETEAGPIQVSELSVCHGGKYQPVQTASAGDVVCLSGFASVKIGDGIGACAGTHIARDTIPLMETAVSCDASVPTPRLLEIMRTLEDENPSLCVRASSDGEICVRVMGTIETEVIGRIVADRFGVALTFGKPRVLFMETVSKSGTGVGHYEPLRHYAEVWLKVSPAPRGSGISFVSRVHVDTLALNWQRLIETHIFERTYPGVLTGAQLTDVRIELLAGRAHLKHTEGGDFREATCRALRCALMTAENVLLEPAVNIRLRFSEDLYGRVLGDLHDMRAEIDLNETRDAGTVTMNARCKLRDFMDYPVAFRALTHGRGILHMTPAGYEPAYNADAVISERGYDPLAEDTPDSVFCSHGAGHPVHWTEALTCAHTVPVITEES